MRSLGRPLLLAVCAVGAPARAEPRQVAGDRYDFTVRAETHVELFQRAFLPGPAGALVSTGTVVPLHEYVSLRADDIDGPLAQDSVDVEIAAWGSRWLGQAGPEPRLDGDVQTAFVRYHPGPFSLRLGRQHVAGGAARFSHFDGGDVAFSLGGGATLEAYGGLTVLPRWNQHATYQYLGAVPAPALRDPSAFGPSERTSHWLAGGRLGWSTRAAALAASFHEQREDAGLARRELGADARVELSPATRVGASTLAELDALALADLRAFVELTPLPALTAAIDALHTEPARLLSRSSVLSVFSTSSYDEVGGAVSLDAARWLSVDASGYAELYSEDEPGSRGELGVRVIADRVRRTVLRVGYSRLVAPGNGYYALRSALSREFLPFLLATVDLHGYFYDQPIRGYRSSSLCTGSLTYRVSRMLRVMWGTSVVRSPYARLDAQTLLDAVLDFDLGTRGRWR